MSKTLETVVPVTDVAEVVHHGEKFIIPEALTINQAIDVLYKRGEYLEATVEIAEKFDVFPFDGAYALSQVIQERYGWAQGKSIISMFGEQKPQIFKIPCSVSEKVDVPWGHFELPNVDGVIMTSADRSATGRFIFNLTAQVKRKDEPTIRALFDELREYLKTHSLYRGKAIKIRFRDDEGNPHSMPEPEFMDVSGISPDGLLLNDDLTHSINANLFTPITRVKDCLDNNIKVKRGILLGGKYGTGKTLAATVAARLAQDNGITYVYTPRADELGDAIAFAKQYQSPACVVFCEDIDRSITGGRTVKIDDILNILDGIDTKGENIITVLTTNHLTDVNQAMLRPGRLDAILDIVPPDAKTASRLARHYGGGAINKGEDLSSVGDALAGQIPAVIEETVKRAKLFQLALLDEGEIVTDLSAQALHQAAVTMTTQIELLKEVADPEAPALDVAFSESVKVVMDPIEKKVKKLSDKFEQQFG